jgi:hypothetical protein
MDKIVNHPTEPIFTAIAVSAGGAIASMSAALAALLDNVTTNAHSGVLDDERMRLVCVIGAIGGAVISALIFTPPKATGRQFAIKIAASSLAGIFFTPAIIYKFGMEITFDVVAPSAAAVALVSVGALRVLVPLWEKHFTGRFRPPNAEDDEDE